MTKSELFFADAYEPLFDLSTPCRYFIITGGRDSGKSFAISTALCCSLMGGCHGKNTLYLRQTLTSAHISIIPEFWEKIELLHAESQFDRTKTEIVNRQTGANIFFRGIQTSKGTNEANLKSVKNVATVLIDEAQELVDEAAFDRIDLSIREKDVPNRVILSLNPTSDKSHWIYRRFFQERGIPDDFNGIHGNTCYIHTTCYDNWDHVPDDVRDIIEEMRINKPAKYRNVILGFWGGEPENALWKRSTMIDAHRIANPPGDLERIVVAVDPAVTNREHSDDTGIIVAGSRRISGDQHYYVLGDYSLRGSPGEWASEAVRQYREYLADRLVAEVNQGGDLVEQTIRNIDPRISYKAVRATRGKIIRAEPIAELYERGLVHHVGIFPMLEDQMCSYCGYDGQKSPDRMDALVWALTELSNSAARGSASSGSARGLLA